MRPALLILALSFLAGAASAHDHWINHGRYTNPKTGELCCGEEDCFMVAEENVKVTAAGYLLTGGELIPYDEAQKSEDGRYWRCQRYDRAKSRRCFFAPEPAT